MTNTPKGRAQLWNQARAKHNRKTPTSRPMTTRVIGEPTALDMARNLEAYACHTCGYHKHAPTCAAIADVPVREARQRALYEADKARASEVGSYEWAWAELRAGRRVEVTASPNKCDVGRIIELAPLHGAWSHPGFRFAPADAKPVDTRPTEIGEAHAAWANRQLNAGRSIRCASQFFTLSPNALTRTSVPVQGWLRRFLFEVVE